MMSRFQPCQPLIAKDVIRQWVQNNSWQTSMLVYMTIYTKIFSLLPVLSMTHHIAESLLKNEQDSLKIWSNFTFMQHALFLRSWTMALLTHPPNDSLTFQDCPTLPNLIEQIMYILLCKNESVNIAIKNRFLVMINGHCDVCHEIDLVQTSS